MEHGRGQVVVGAGGQFVAEVFVDGALVVEEPEREGEGGDVRVEGVERGLRLAEGQHRARPAVENHAVVLDEAAEADQVVGVGREFTEGTVPGALVGGVLPERRQRDVRVGVEEDRLLRQAGLAQETAGRLVRERRREVDLLEAGHPAVTELLVQQAGGDVQGEAGGGAGAA